jgi:hypothetical protein
MFFVLRATLLILRTTLFVLRNQCLTLRNGAGNQKLWPNAQFIRIARLRQPPTMLSVHIYMAATPRVDFQGVADDSRFWKKPVGLTFL